MTLLGNVLNQYTGGQNQQREAAPAPAPVAPARAAIHVAMAINNAFAIRFELSAFEKDGQLDLGVYQGTDRAAGYRLIYRPGGTTGLELLRVSSRGAGVVYRHSEALAVVPKRTHIVEWTRDSEGEMVVSLDGKELIRAADRGYRDSFDGFEMINQEGDFLLAGIRIEGLQ